MLVSRLKKATLIAATIKMALFTEYCYSNNRTACLAFFGEEINNKKIISEVQNK